MVDFVGVLSKEFLDPLVRVKRVHKDVYEGLQDLAYTAVKAGIRNNIRVERSFFTEPLTADALPLAVAVRMGKGASDILLCFDLEEIRLHKGISLPEDWRNNLPLLDDSDDRCYPFEYNEVDEHLVPEVSEEITRRMPETFFRRLAAYVNSGRSFQVVSNSGSRAPGVE